MSEEPELLTATVSTDPTLPIMPTIEQLETLLAADPDDTFLNFGLAMALAREGRTEEALARFDRTLAVDGGYVPAHFQKGRVLAACGRVEEAKAALERGIAAADAAGDEHASGEMREFLGTLDP